MRNEREKKNGRKTRLRGSEQKLNSAAQKAYACIMPPDDLKKKKKSGEEATAEGVSFETKNTTIGKRESALGKKGGDRGVQERHSQIRRRPSCHRRAGHVIRT